MKKKRHYLKGFYPRLLKLEKDKKIKIIKVKKNNWQSFLTMGGLYLYGSGFNLKQSF